LAAITEDDAVAYLIPYVPGQHMQSLGTAYLRTRTCLIPNLHLPERLREPTLDCWGTTGHHGSSAADGGSGGGSGNNTAVPEFNLNNNDGSDFLVFASAAKAGAVLSARVVGEVGAACGLCVASGERSRPGIPGPLEELPVYEGKLLHAIINVRKDGAVSLLALSSRSLLSRLLLFLLLLLIGTIRCATGPTTPPAKASVWLQAAAPLATVGCAA
jgi:hypothetical protein